MRNVNAESEKMGERDDDNVGNTGGFDDVRKNCFYLIAYTFSVIRFEVRSSDKWECILHGK